MTELAVERGSWLRRFGPAVDADTRLICFPHAGGAATFYFPLFEAMRPHTEVRAVQYPGRQERRREPAIDDVRVLADRIAEMLQPLPPGPFAFFGHSMGAIVAFEVAARLERAGCRTPVRLFASGSQPPSYPRDSQVRLLSDEALLARLVRLEGLDPSLADDEEMVRMILPAIRTDYHAIENYPPSRARLSCPITAFVGDSDPMVAVGDVAAWSAHTTAAFDTYTFGGGHFYLTPRHDEMASRIHACLIS
jgi:surfactin synthase thioesterase subunit